MDAVIVLTGSREWTAVTALEAVLMDAWHDALQLGYTGIVLRHGDCPDGADAAGDAWARRNDLPVDPMAADWDSCGDGCPARPHRIRRPPGDRLHPGVLPDYCPVAGPRRNRRLVAKDPVPVLCVAAPLGRSVGTRGCMRLARAAGVPVRLVEPATGGTPR